MTSYCIYGYKVRDINCKCFMNYEHLRTLNVHFMVHVRLVALFRILYIRQLQWDKRGDSCVK